MVNPKVKEGDRVMLLYMKDEIDVPMGTQGRVTNVTRDPFEPEGDIIQVNWDNGSNLSVLSTTDIYKKVIDDETLNESEQGKFMIQNEDLFDDFDYILIRRFLEDLRNSGVVNMFTAAPFLYMGRETMERYYGENPANEEAFQKVLDNSEVVKNELISGSMKNLESVSDLKEFERKVKKNAQRFLNLFMVYY
jgi:hypothetical protein